MNENIEQSFLEGRKIAVLMGGWSSERDISLISGKAVGDALKEMGFDPLILDLQSEEDAEKRIKNINLSAVGGPCLAQGLANRVHSGVVIANKDLNTAKSLSKILKTNYYHITPSSDINGVEVCAAIKNIFSMVIGAATGLNKLQSKGNFYLNTSATLVKQSVYEMEVFAEFLKGKKETVKGLAGLGDLSVSYTHLTLPTNREV